MTNPRSWATSERWVPRRFVRPLVRFTETEAASGIVLLGAAIIALTWANSPFSDSYTSLLEIHVTIELAGFGLDESVLELINDGLMTVFFFVVGLEIKRELLLGELSDTRAAVLPVVAALGGMVLPAAIYLGINAGAAPEALRGWGIPMATDIAFAVGIVALLGSRVAPGAKVFLLAVAIADDIGAIVVIAVFYSRDLHTGSLLSAVLVLAVVWVAAKINVRAMWFYVPMAFIAWFLTLESGVHATLVGVALAFLTPARPNFTPEELDGRARAVLDQFAATTGPEQQERSDHEALQLALVARESLSPLVRLEQQLVGWSSFVIVPLFALANAGVDFRGVSVIDMMGSRVALGVAAGLVVGKLVGISGFTWLAVRLGLGRLPAGMGVPQVLGISAVAGVGFTVAIFIAGLAFTEPSLADMAKLGIFVGSPAAGVLGSLLLLRGR
ncbi:MAG: Na+/H+ antiporter NhaA [Actinobacteria bacterium]|nr:Na+/H+ antiporter NhaA [Actinomycetota bacterium]